MSSLKLKTLIIRHLQYNLETGESQYSYVGYNFDKIEGSVECIVKDKEATITNIDYLSVCFTLHQ